MRVFQKRPIPLPEQDLLAVVQGLLFGQPVGIIDRIEVDPVGHGGMVAGRSRQPEILTFFGGQRDVRAENQGPVAVGEVAGQGTAVHRGLGPDGDGESEADFIPRFPCTPDADIAFVNGCRHLVPVDPEIHLSRVDPPDRFADQTGP